jgi:hypothetical protein
MHRERNKGGRGAGERERVCERGKEIYGPINIEIRRERNKHRERK